jgi:hypothetical protein
MKKIGLSSTHSFYGEWWLPENPEVRKGGELTIESAKVRLNLTDSLFSSSDDSELETLFSEVGVIHGSLTKAGLVTLIKSKASTGFAFNRGYTARPMSARCEYLANILVKINNSIQSAIEFLHSIRGFLSY